MKKRTLKISLFLVVVATSFFLFQLKNQPLIAENQLTVETSESKNLKITLPVSREIISKRDRTSKHFLKEDGITVSAILSPTSLNYKDESGNWKSIETDLIASSNPQYLFESTKNNLKSWFPNNPSEDGILLTTEISEVVMGKNLKLNWQTSKGVILNSQKLYTADPQVKENTITYKNVQPTIDNQYVIYPDKVEQNIILNTKLAIPEDIAMLSFSEEIMLPNNWNIQLDQNEMGLVILNEKKEVYLEVPFPEIYEENNRSVMANSTNSGFDIVKLDRNTFQVHTNISSEWLNERTYPVIVDPTIVLNGSSSGNIIKTNDYRDSRVTGWDRDEYQVNNNSSAKIALNYYETTLDNGHTYTSESTNYKGWIKYNTASIADEREITNVAFSANISDSSTGSWTTGIYSSSIPGSYYNGSNDYSAEYNAITAHNHGSIEFSSTGQYPYTTLTNEANLRLENLLEEDYFQIGLYYGSSSSSSETFKTFDTNQSLLKVDYLLDVPTANDDAVTVTYESSNNIISVLANDIYGSDNLNATHPLTLVNGKQSTASLKGGLISVSGNGTPNDASDDVVLYSAPAGFSGTDSFEYTITDEDGDAATATVTITVDPAAPLAFPTAVDDTFSVANGSSNNDLNILDNDSFGSEGLVSVTLSVGSKGGTLVINQNGTGDAVDITVTYTPATLIENEVETFNYTLEDGGGDTATATVSILVGTVVPVPTAIDDAVTVVAGSVGNAIDVLANDTPGSDGYIDGGLTMTNGTLTSASTKGSAISIDNKNTADTTDDVFNYTPSALAVTEGTDTFQYTITDASGDASTATVTVTVNPAAPVVGAVDDSVSVAVNSTDNVIDVLGNDNVGNGVGTMLINSFDHLTGTTSEGGTLTLDDGGTTGINQADDKILYTPPTNFNGVDTFDYTLTVDGNQYQGTVTVTVGTVIPPSTTPTAVDDTATVGYESTNTVIAVLANDSYGTDGLSATHPLTLVNGKQSTASVEGGLISVSDNGTALDRSDDVVLYSAPAGFRGADSFEYAITDLNGDAATAKVTITVGNSIPKALNDSVSVDVDSSNNVIDILGNDSFGTDGANTPPMSFSAGLITQGFYITTDTSAEGGTVSIVNDAEIHYTPATNFEGTDSFDYYIYDASGDRSRGVVTVTVGTPTPVEDTPTASDDVATVNAGSVNNTIDVLANDTPGLDGYIDGGLTMTNGTLTSASTKGSAISIDNKNTLDTTDDEFIYTPSALAVTEGTDTFNYTITDASGDASTATVTVTIGAPAPVEGAVEDEVSVAVNSTDNLIDVLANDNFGTFGSGTLLINSANHLTGTTAEGGTLTLDDGGTSGINQADDKILYTPPANFNGIDTFDYTLTVDANQYQGTVTITVGTVVPPVEVPTAVNDFATVSYESTNTIINVLSNDTYGSDGLNATHPLTLVNGKQSTASLEGGLISVSDNNTANDASDDVVLYSAPAGFSGTDSFEYTITDLNGDASKATVTITVNSAKSSNNNTSFDDVLTGSFSIYPNPSNGYINTRLSSNVATEARMILFDTTGRVVYQTTLTIQEGINQFDFNVEAKAGILFMKIISTEKDFGTSKIVFK